jgi:hypothetical protein
MRRLAFSLIVCLALAGCGGSHEQRPAMAPFSQAHAVCAKFDPTLRQDGMPPSAARLANAQAQATGELRALIALTPPAGEHSAFKHLLDERNAEVILLGRLGATHGAKARAQVATALRTHARKGDADARTLGLSECRHLG